MKTVFRGKAMCWMFAMLLLGVSLPAPGNARAEEPDVMGLDGLIRMALQNSPELQEADQDIAAAKSDLKQAKAGQWAQLDAMAAIGPAQDAKTPIVFVNPATHIGTIENRDVGRVNVFGSLDINIVQPLYTFGKISNRQDAAAYGLDVQQSARKKKQNEVVLNIKELYYALIVAKQGEGAASDANAFIRDAKERIQRLIALKSKNVDESDLYRLTSYEAEIEQFKAKAKSGANLAYIALKKAVGYPPEREFKLDVSELPKETASLESQEAYVEKALESRPEFEQLKKGIAARKSLADAATADLYPSIFGAVVGSFAGAPGRQRLDNSYFRDEFNHSEVGVVVGGQWHFDLGIGQGKVDKARAEYQKLIHTKEFAERNIPVEVAKYYQDARESEASFTAFEKSAVSARQWIVASFSNFDFGVGTAKDMLDAIEKYGKNQGEYLSSLYNYRVALARLTYAIGEYRELNP